MGTDWLLDEIIEGLKKLLVLSLPGQPASETVALTAIAWLEAVIRRDWNEDLDRWRVRESFRQLLADCDRWPSPRMLLDRLPARRELQRLPKPDISPEQAQANLKRIREMLKPITDKAGKP